MGGICQRACLWPGNVEPKLLGKLRLMSEFHPPESRRQLSRHKGEIRPGCCCPGQPLPSLPQGHAAAAGGSAAGLRLCGNQGGRESPEFPPTGSTHLGPWGFLGFFIFTGTQADSSLLEGAPCRQALAPQILISAGGDRGCWQGPPTNLQPPRIFLPGLARSHTTSMSKRRNSP